MKKYCCNEFKKAVKNKEILKMGSRYYRPNVYVDDFWKDVLNIILNICPYCERSLTTWGALKKSWQLTKRLSG